MSIAIIFICFVASSFLIFINRIRAGLFLNCIGIFLLFFLGTHLVPDLMLKNLQAAPFLSEPVWSNKNVIIILGMGTLKWSGSDSVKNPSFSFARLFEGVRLYHDCQKKSEYCKILVTGGDPLKNGISEAEVMRRDLISIGIPDENIILEDKSLNTFQNALYSSKLIKELNLDSVFLVSSGLHIQRAQLYFKHFLINTTAAPADYVKTYSSLIPLSGHFFLFDRALHEYLGVVRYWVYNFLGWNLKPGVAGSP